MKKFRPTLRTRHNKDWSGHDQANIQFLGMSHLGVWIWSYFKREFPNNLTNNTAIEIGSHMGEGLPISIAILLFLALFSSVNQVFKN